VADPSEKKALKNRVSEGVIVTFFTPIGLSEQKNHIFSALPLGDMGFFAIHSACREAFKHQHFDDHGEMYGEGAKSSSKEEGRSQGRKDRR
jgi:hypothetical protein